MLGATAGAWLVAPIMMRLGRRAGVLASGSTALLGWLGVALLPEPLGILLARGLSGLAAGGLSLVANSFGIELADPEVRGMMAMVLNLGILLGQVVTVCVGYDARYFVVALVDMALPLGLILSLFHLPESPSYLVLKGREGEAREVLLDLRGRYADIEGEIQSYKDLNHTSDSKGAWRDLLRPQVLKDLAVVSTLFILMYFTGYQVISANTSRMFEAAGSSVDDSLSTIIVNVVQVAAAAVASPDGPPRPPPQHDALVRRDVRVAGRPGRVPAGGGGAGPAAPGVDPPGVPHGHAGRRHHRGESGSLHPEQRVLPDPHPGLGRWHLLHGRQPRGVSGAAAVHAHARGLHPGGPLCILLVRVPCRNSLHVFLRQRDSRSQGRVRGFGRSLVEGCERVW
nr:facilitated trehalose transporter Tret1-like isoform X2 [Penaeus vannamei]